MSRENKAKREFQKIKSIITLRVIRILEESLKTHKDWASYFSRHPAAMQLPEHKKIGDVNFHQKCAREYSRAIAEIKTLLQLYKQAKSDEVS